MGVFKYLSLKNNIVVYERKYPNTVYYTTHHWNLVAEHKKLNLALSKWSFKEI